MNRWRIPLMALGAAAAIVVGAGCNALLDFGAYSVEGDAAVADSHPAHGDTGGSGKESGTDGRTSHEGGQGKADGGRDGTSPSDAPAPHHDGGLDGTMKGDAEAGCPTPTTRPTFESACTSATCAPFDESRVPLFDGASRALPTPDGSTGDAGSAPSADGGGFPPCPTTNTVYATGSTALETLLAAAAQALSSSLSFIYQPTGSCIGVQSIVNESYLMAGTATAYSMSGTSTCSLPAGGVTVDIGISDVFAQTCQTFESGLPAYMSENYGPVQVMTFAVPSSSTQTSISLEAAYDVFGFGSASGVSPWTNAQYILQRNSSSGTQNMIGATIGVPAAQWQGVMNASTGSMLDALIDNGKADGGVPDETIGILVAGTADTNRTTIHVLAFQDEGQGCGYFPDTSSSARDKYNVRNGHYPIWGPSHFYNRVNGSGQPLNAYAQTFINDLSGITELPGVDLITLYAQNSVIPLCAMHVQRSSDGNGYSPYTPPASCNCYYDLEATTHTSCQTCTGPGTCPQSAPVCRTFSGNSYCEPE